MSSYLAFRYIDKDDVDFFQDTKHSTAKLPTENECIYVDSPIDIDNCLKEIFEKHSEKKMGILLSGGMDSACLASYMPKGSKAYTFRFLGGKYDSDELHRAEIFASHNDIELEYVDIDWNIIEKCVDVVMKGKGAPVHSIEPQLYVAAMQAKSDGIELLVIGDAADYVFYGMDGLLAKDWEFNEFVERTMYLNPKDILKDPADVSNAYEKYRKGKKIDFIGFYNQNVTEESYSSYENAFKTADIPFIDPYEYFKMKSPVDLKRIRNGDSKYFIRELFKMKYPDIALPEKHPMPRPVDEYFKDWEGPTRPEFKENLDMKEYTGNQKWLIWCLQRFLNNHEFV